MRRLLDDVMVDEPTVVALPSNSLARPIWTLPTASSQPEPPSTTMMFELWRSPSSRHDRLPP
ncbi:MAG: hypothetical protein ACLTYW_00905 [Collinsella sp.]